MKICYLNFDGGPTLEAIDSRTGGLNITLFNLPKAMSLFPNTKITVIWRADGKENRYLNELQDRGIELIKIKVGPNKSLSREKLEKTLLEFTGKISDYLATHKFDIIYTFGSEAGFVMSIIKEKGVCNSAIWFHKNFATLSVRRVMVEGMSMRKALSDIIGQREEHVLKKCDHIVASTNIEKEEIKKVFDIESNKISVIFPGVNQDIFRPPRLSTERLPIIISAGRMTKIKDFPFLLRVFKRVVDFNSDIESLLLIIVGGNKKERDRLGLKEMVRELSIENFVSFVDGVPQEILAKYFQISRVFVGTSKHETFGRLPVESRGCGTPFIVRANSSYLAMAKNGEGGYVTNNNSEKAMAKKIGAILRLPFTEWQKRSHLAIESVKKFSWEKSAEEHLQLYHSLFSKKEIAKQYR